MRSNKSGQDGRHSQSLGLVLLPGFAGVSRETPGASTGSVSVY